MDTRPPPPAGPPPSYALISRVYQRSLRPVLLSTTAVGVVYAAIWGASAFHDIGDDKQVLAHISTFDIVIGSLYMGVLCVELFGFYSAWLQRASLVRMYTFLSVGVALVVMAAELIRIVIHFMFKSDIIDACVKSVTSPSPDDDDPLTLPDGQRWCKNSFNRSSFSDIAWFIVATIFSWLFSSIAFSYLHQLLSVGTRIAPTQQIPLDNFRTTSYDPPNYPPPNQVQNPYVPPYDGQKVPDYEAGYGHSIGGDKAPGYEYPLGGDGKRDLKGVADSDDEEDRSFGITVGPAHSKTNPFRA